MKRWTSRRFPFSRGHSVGAVLIMGSDRAEWDAKPMSRSRHDIGLMIMMISGSNELNLKERNAHWSLSLVQWLAC